DLRDEQRPDDGTEDEVEDAEQDAVDEPADETLPPLGEHQARGLGGRRALLRGAVRLLGSAVLLRRGPVGLLLPVLLGRLPVPGRGGLLAGAGRGVAVSRAG